MFLALGDLVPVLSPDTLLILFICPLARSLDTVEVFNRAPFPIDPEPLLEFDSSPSRNDALL